MSKDELMDEELAGMVSYTDETVPAEMPTMEVKPRNTDNADQGVKRVKKGPVFRDEYYVPVPKAPKAKRNLVDRLFDCVVWLGVCGGIAMLLWWFWQNDLMAMEAAYPCILACGVIGAFGAGINMAR